MRLPLLPLLPRIPLLPLLLAALLAFPSRALAHDLWIERQADQLVLQSGHRGERLLPLDAAKVKALRCASGAEAPKDVLASAKAEPTRVAVAASCGAASAFLDGGFFSLTPDGEKNLPRSQVPDAVKAWESRQFAKWVDPRSPAAARPLGDELEIVPVSDLTKARQGDKATFRVLLAGKPVAGAVLAIDHKALGETDSAGEVRVKVRAQGLECVSATLRRPVKSADADQLVLEASLAFEVAKLKRAGFTVAALLAWLVPAAALGHEVLHAVEQGKAWALKASYADGEALAYVPFEVYSPADPKIPYLKGRTDRSGYVAFVPDVPGAWRVKIIDDTGHGLDTTVEVAALGAPPPTASGAQASAAGFALRPLVGAAVILVLFGGLLVLYRRRGAP